MPVLEIDGAVAAAAATAELAQLVGRLGPFGSGNPEPRFAITDLRVVRGEVVGDGHVRAVLADGLTRMGATVSAIASSSDGPATKLDRFIEAFVRMTETRPWMPALMLREIAEGAPRLDAGTMSQMRTVIASFASILSQGQESGIFRRLHPILAYESVVGPIIINAARERVAAQPQRQGDDFPMLAAISHDEVIAHSQDTARRMLAP